MRTLLKSMFAVLPLALFAQTPAVASENWKQPCSGPQYVCGHEAGAKTVATKQATKAHKAKTIASEDKPVKAKKKVAQAHKTKKVAAVHKAKKVASAPKAKKVAKASAGGGSSFQSGMASWYGGNFHGRRTANGETYNMNALTAAHKTLPFGTRVRVTNTRNGDSVVVRINDRGPFVGGRVIDLSRAAASQIGVTSSGVAPVKLAVLGRG